MTEYTEDRFSIKIMQGIVYVEFLVAHADYNLVNDMITKRLEITKDNTYPMFSDLRLIKSNTRESRERMAGKDAGFGVSGVAILINSKIHRIMYSFFHNIYKSPAPARLFTDRDKALKWLEQYK